jgi:radical SAM protein with 4Fe4S-binding SPASM domain
MKDLALTGLSTINVELTSRCNKRCSMCGRRKIERDFPGLAKWGDMDFDLVEEIARQVPSHVVVQFHNNGEPLMYPRFGEAVELFENQYRCIDTNGKLLVEKAGELVGIMDSIAVSVIPNDPDAGEQYRTVVKFLELKGRHKPLMIYRCLGRVDFKVWEKLPGIMAKRVLHNPRGSYDYEKEVTKPEIGVCLDLLHHLAIDRYGNVSPCVRFDPYQKLVLGNLHEKSLAELWNGKKRKRLLNLHWAGNRDQHQFCAVCEYWGVPRGN